ncbi:transferase family-domain-containing protein, partial [Glomus cerebriforme]
IPFIIAESPDITIQQLEEKNWQPSSIPDHLVPDLPVTHGLISLPLDVPLLMARQEPIIPPVHDRSLLKASGNPPTHEHPEFKLFKLPTEASQAMPPMPPMITKLFHINRDNLKKLCNVYSGEHNLVSANDALVAHLWRLVTRARGIPLDAEVICAFPCDGRKRLKPFFPPNYFGNCILNTVLKMLVSELINGSQPNLALQIRKAIDKVNDSKIRSSIDWIEQQPNKSEIKLNYLA